ncbi:MULTISPECIES: hypothetical protein [Bacillota]|uniref:hypothetical protein n=1 Tax=Bacillota TaxID=1239 RepID=UPI0039EE076B
METISDVNIYEYTDQKLKAHFQNNEQFNFELAQTFNFYKELLQDLINDSDRERLEKDLFQSVKAQIFNGYYMAQELLQSEEANFNDEWFKQSKGMIAQQLPDMLRMATNYDIDGIITHEPLKALASWLVIEYEGVYPLLMDISINTACMGAKWAFIDEGEKRGIPTYQSQYLGLLSHIDDVLFIDPQTYLSCEYTNDSSEVWNAITSKHTGLDKIAEVTIIKVTSGETTENYYMNLNIKNSLSITEQQILIDNLAVRLMLNKEIERNQLILAAASVEEFYVINNNL